MTQTSVVQFNNDQLALIRQTVAKGTNEAEFRLFIEVCNYHQLNPFARQIYAVVREGYGGRQMTIQTSIDGYRLLAERSGKYAGQIGPEWCGDDGIWRDVWLSDKAPVAARVGVLRKDFSHPTWGVAKYRSYAQTKKDGMPTTMWQKMPDVMLAKCAESLALRKAFPAEMSGIYTAEEMQQADHDLPTVDHTFTGGTTVEADPAPTSTPPAPRNLRAKPASQPAPQPSEPTEEQMQAKATDQQKASISKLCQHVSMSVPDLESMSFVDAKALIAQLTAEYKNQREENKQSQPAPAQPKITPQQAERIRNLCKALGESEPAGLAELAYFDAKALYEQLAAKYKTQKQATPQAATGPDAPIQDKATAAMVNKAKSRAESIDMLWGDIKRDALGNQVDDKDITVAQYAKISSVIETYEQKKAS